MPLSTVLPPPRPVIIGRCFGPFVNAFVQNGGLLQGGGLVSSTGGSGSAVTRAHVGGAGVELQYHNYLGRQSARLRTAATSAGEGWATVPQTWYPPFDETLRNPGARIHPQSVVLTWDWSLAISAGAAFPATPADSTGFFWWPADNSDGLATMDQYVPAAGNSGGFGVFANDDGGGNAEWQYVAWEPAGVLERVSLPVADVTVWNTFRCIVLTATPGTAAELRVEVNGVEALRRNFDGVTLMRPTDINATAMKWLAGWELGPGWGAAGVSGINVRFQAFTSRFTPDGVAQQPL